MQFKIIYLNNDPDIFLKKCAFVKRLEKEKEIIFSDRVISRRAGIIFLHASYEKMREIVINNADLLKFYDSGTQKEIVIS